MIPRQISCLAFLAVLAPACDSNDGSRLQADFLPDVRTQGPNQVFLSREGIEGDRLAIAVRVRDTTNVNAADLILTYDPSRVAFHGSAVGSLLQQGGGTVSYDVAETAPGQLRVRVTRTSGGTVSAGTDDPVLVLLSFHVVRAGSASAAFGSGSQLSDDTPTPLSGVTFYGGTFVGS